VISSDDLTVWLLFISAGMFLASAAILVYTCALLLKVRRKIKQFTWRPEVVRDADGRKRQERV
jgi:hypothetical protein